MKELHLNAARAPLYEAIAVHERAGTASFHVPGHKSGGGIDREAYEYFHSIATIDYTEITGLDDLHQPEGVIQEAQRLAADCFGAEQTFFLVGGSTVGNLAMITAVCDPGDLLLVQRNVHKSVINGLVLAGARAVFLAPQWDGIATGVRAEDVELALARYPEAKALLITNPNYYGMGIHLEPIAELLHQQSKPLLVDEAHGAHFGFHPDLPSSALSCGADAVVQSTHKMLSAMTMGAMLHIQGSLIDRQAVKKQLSMLQSSSPSYPILASLDLARRQMHTNGATLIQKGLDVIHAISARLKELPCFHHVKQRTYSADPFKIVLYDKSGTLTGPELREQLELRGCFAEMADPKHVLLLFSPYSTYEDANRLYEALKDICACFGLNAKPHALTSPVAPKWISFTDISSPVDFAEQRSSRGNIRTVSLQEAVGHRSADMIIPYPPGIPLLYPGEVLTDETARYLEELFSQGIKFQGAASARLHQLHIRM